MLLVRELGRRHGKDAMLQQEQEQAQEQGQHLSLATDYVEHSVVPRYLQESALQELFQVAYKPGKTSPRTSEQNTSGQSAVP